MKNYYTVKEYAKILNIHPQTLRRYTRQGLISCERTLGNHRRFIKENNINNKDLVIGYVRVSTYDQKKDLVTQEKALIYQAKESKNIVVNKVIKDLGSGMNYKKKGFKELLTLILSNRLLRFGSEIIFNSNYFRRYCSKPPLEKLSLDLLEIITVFSSRIYGMRKYKIK